MAKEDDQSARNNTKPVEYNWKEERAKIAEIERKERQEAEDFLAEHGIAKGENEDENNSIDNFISTTMMILAYNRKQNIMVKEDLHRIIWNLVSIAKTKILAGLSQIPSDNKRNIEDINRIVERISLIAQADMLAEMNKLDKDNKFNKENLNLIISNLLKRGKAEILLYLSKLN